VPLSLGVLLSQCILYVHWLTYYLHMRTWIINFNSSRGMSTSVSTWMDTHHGRPGDVDLHLNLSLIVYMANIVLTWT